MTYPSIIYKKFHKYKPLSEMSGLQWFALENSYGDGTYGNITKSYRFKREPKLLNIGDADVRVEIEEEIKKTGAGQDIINNLDPNEQYSGGPFNKKYHEIIKGRFINEYDGTIIDESQLKGNDKYSIEDLEGPTEIVIWRDFEDLLEEQSSGGKKRKKTKKRKYRVKHRKSKRNRKY
jgi:hypothetical protein